MEFKILKKSKISRGRLGLLKTSHGVVETPCLVPVATQAVIKTLESQEVKETKSQILIANTFHLHLKPGEEVVKRAGGLHKFMNWQASLMTDSGGFQVFSLGFGKDLGIGKILAPYRPARGGAGAGLKYFPDKEMPKTIKEKSQPKSLKITDHGVYFYSSLNGDQLFLGPKESIKIQEDLGADIIFAFDECAPPLADFKYTKESLERTHKWAEICLKAKKSRQALFGIVQGGKYKNLRIESARFIGRLPFDGFGIGGEFGYDKRKMVNALNWIAEELPGEKPRHLLGVGYLEDMEAVIKSGIDLFDCTVPTHYGRRGIAFTGKGDKCREAAIPQRPGLFNRVNLNQSKFLKDKNPLDKNCECFVCQNYKRNYICHLLRAKEITALKLLTFHNLYFFNTFVGELREKIKKGKM